MDTLEDYYDALGISSHATAEDIKNAYRYKVQILHPDRLAKVPESVRLKAEKELRLVNRAYENLSNPRKRAEYDSERNRRRGQHERTQAKPTPVVEPNQVTIDNVTPGEARRQTFSIRNTGGPYKKFSIQPSDVWLRVVDIKPMTAQGELPAQVIVEATAFDYDLVRSQLLTVVLDAETASAHVTLRSEKRPARPEPAFSAESLRDDTASRRGSTPSWGNNVLAIVAALAILAGIGLVGRYVKTMPEIPTLALPETTTTPPPETSSSGAATSDSGLDRDAVNDVLLGRWRHGLPEECPPGMDSRMYEKAAEIPEQETYYLEFSDGGGLSCIRTDVLTQGRWEIVDPGVVRLAWPIWQGEPPYGLRDGETLYRVVPQDDSDRFYLVDDRDLSLGFWPT